jgi:hypothetical protein
MEENTCKGGCFCGAVQLSVSGSPEAMGYCHCTSCRSWAAAPVTAFTLWKPENVKVTQGAENIGVFHKTERSYRKFCRICGGHLMTAHPSWSLVDVYAAVISDIRFEPKVHVNYGESVTPMADGLPKFKDLPQEMGGSGETLPE